MNMFNKDIKKVDSILEKYNSSRMSLDVYNNIKVLENYSSKDYKVEPNLLYEKIKRTNRMKEYSNISENYLMFYNFLRILPNNSTNNFDKERQFDDKYMYMIIADFFLKYDKEALDILVKLIGDNNIIETNSISYSGNVSYLKPSDEMIIFEENNYDIITAANLVRDVELLKEITKNKNINHDYSRINALYMTKKFLNFVDSQYGKDSTYYYQNYYNELEKKKEMLEKLMIYGDYKNIKLNNDEDCLDIIPSFIGDIISDQLCELSEDEVYKTINYINKNSKSRFNKELLNVLMRTDKGIVESVNRQYIKRTNINKI